MSERHYWVRRDGHGDLCLWDGRGDFPRLVLRFIDLPRENYNELVGLIMAGVEAADPR